MSNLYLAADVGGTNVRICIVNSSSEIVSTKNVYATKDYSSFKSIVEDFFQDQPDKKAKISKACFAVAGPVLMGKCKITNLPWDELDDEKLSSELGFEVTLINDFVAQGYNIILDPNKKIHTLQEGIYDPQSPVGIIGAGTGLGKAFAIPTGDSTLKVFPTEGGHVNFAPRNDLEEMIMKSLRPKYQAICQESFNLSPEQVESLSIDEEAVLSGSGIVDIFGALKEFYPDHCAEEILCLPEHEQAAAIAISATKKTNILAEKTMDIFIETYGAVCGNFAVNLLPFGGIYIAGGIAAKNISLIEEKKDLFLNAFNTKVRVNPLLLKRCPIHIITNELSGLNGAINYLTKI
jgi:glucokinase